MHVRVTPDVLIGVGNWQPGSLEAWKAPGYSDRTAISRTVHTYYISVITVSVIGKQPQPRRFSETSSSCNWAIMRIHGQVSNVVAADIRYKLCVAFE